MEKGDWKKVAVGGGWNLGDFEYKDNAVTGISEKGRVKLRNNKDLVLPNLAPVGEVKSFKDLKPLEVVEKYAFHQLGLESVVIPRTVKVIKEFAFDSNYLTNIFLHEGIETIEDFAFSMNNITEIVFPKSLQNIGNMVLFSNNIENIIVRGRCKNLKNNLTENLYVKKLSLEDEDSDEEDLSQISKIFLVIDFLDLGKLKNIKKIPDNAFARYGVKDIIFPPNIERIGVRAFRKNELKNIVIPDSVKAIEDEAFIYNPVECLKLGRNVAKIGKDAFPNTKEIEKELFRNAVEN